MYLRLGPVTHPQKFTSYGPDIPHITKTKFQKKIMDFMSAGAWCAVGCCADNNNTKLVCAVTA